LLLLFWSLLRRRKLLLLPQQLLLLSVAPSVETAPQEQAVVADAVSAPDQDDIEEGVDHCSDQLLKEEKRTKDEGVHDEVAAQDGIAHGSVGQLVVSFSCICILFFIPDIVM
jgi:hypothetical protein